MNNPFDGITLPKRSRGRQSAKAQAVYEAQVKRFCVAIKQIHSTLDFAVSSRGWCYLLEGFDVVTKGDFDAAERLINDCRKSGLLPIDICAEDSKREFSHVESVDDADPNVFADQLWRAVSHWARGYQPISFWDDKPVYIQMLVEKIDLRELFSPVCARYSVPIANSGGWADIHTRAQIMQRFAEHEAAGRQCVLLYCGDHDPGGMSISDTIRGNLEQLSGAVNWHPDNLIVDRFGLNYDFIVANNLSWIENLETGSGGRLDDPRHADHYKPYVQEYLAQYGARKVEANALVVRPREGRELAERAILRWLGDASAPDDFEQQLTPYREELLTTFRELVRGEL